MLGDGEGVLVVRDGEFVGLGAGADEHPMRNKIAIRSNRLIPVFLVPAGDLRT
jgi:hypothetical protein